MISGEVDASEPGWPCSFSRVAYVDWGLLETAFDESMHGVRRYLHRGTGEVVRLIDGVSDPELAPRLEADRSYVRVVAVGPREQFGWLQAFIETVGSEALRARLAECVRGRGAFGRFKTEIAAHPAEAARWAAFRRERLREAIGRWSLALGLTLVARRPTRPGKRGDPELSALEAAPVGRRVRKRLLEAAGDLCAEDLEALHALAEHLYASQLERLELKAPAALGEPPESDERNGERDGERGVERGEEKLPSLPEPARAAGC